MSLLGPIISYPPLWNVIQRTLGFPEFKQKLYRSALTPPAKLLDFGCANGHIADIFMDFDYYGVDIDKPSIDYAANRFKDHPNMHFVAADIRENPFPENFFDAAIMAATVHHLSDELLADACRGIHRSLKPGGVLHIFDPCVQATDGWQQKLMRRMDQGKFPRSQAQMLAIIEPLNLFEVGSITFHKPTGALIQDCDFIHLPLIKR